MDKHFLLLFVFITQFYHSTSGQNLPIIPKPNSYQFHEGRFQIPPELKLYLEGESLATAYQLISFLDRKLGAQAKITPEKDEAHIVFSENLELQIEAYHLEVNNNKIILTASSEKGWFYALQSLKQLINATYLENENFSLPNLKINDRPRFVWRAFMLDEGRYFKGKEDVKQILDEMAYLKMNVFHWHLVDDQGWRIEIKKYPRLTEVGSKRKSTQVGPLKWKSPIQSGMIHEGFYTHEDIKEVIQYAQERHITIVPEIEMPGHSSAAIAAYPWLGTAKQEIEVPIQFGVGKDVYDVSDPKVFEFLTDVLDETMALFSSQVIHIGGDEVKYDHWKNSIPVQNYMKAHHLKSPADLQIHFTNRISNYLQEKGRRMMGWNEILGHDLHDYQSKEDTQKGQNLATSSIIHFWKGDLELATQAASDGYDIVNSLHSETYLDYSYKSIPLEKAYTFDPLPNGLDKIYHDKIIGTGCQMWGEWIPTRGEMHFQVFPRIAAFAEVGWTSSENKNYETFLKHLPHLYKRWTKNGLYPAPLELVLSEE